MTTIAFKAGVLAADSATNCNGLASGTFRKLARAPDGSIAGAAGSIVLAAAFLRWVEGGMDGPAPGFPNDAGSAFLIRPDGEARLYEANGWFAFPDPFRAIGSGLEVATTAMHLGRSAEEAVRIACDLDTNTRGPVVTLRLGQGS